MPKAKASDPKNIDYVSLESLQFDPMNPRFPRTVKTSDESAVLEWMLRDATIVELMGAIGEKGYFPGEPLLVAKTKTDGVFQVVEGNRRLAALKLLSNPKLATVRPRAVASAAELARERPTDIPVLIYDSRAEILDYLGYRHITGIKEWDPLEKARYLKQLFDAEAAGTPDDRLRHVARLIGSRSDYVARLLTGLGVYVSAEEQDFYGLKVKADDVEFAVLTTAINYTNIASYIGIAEGLKQFDPKQLNHEALRNLLQWMYEPGADNRTRLGESRRLGDLNKILASDKARSRLESGASLETSLSLTQNPLAIHREAVAVASDQLRLAQGQVQIVHGATEGDVENVGDLPVSPGAFTRR